jgi:hypothetical protein
MTVKPQSSDRRALPDVVSIAPFSRAVECIYDWIVLA